MMFDKLKSSSSFLTPNEVNGILFSDVRNIVKEKEDLENILLSSKIVFQTKEEIIEFFDMLIKYGFKESAINYFEDLFLKMNDVEIINKFNSLLK